MLFEFLVSELRKEGKLNFWFESLDMLYDTILNNCNIQ